MKTTPPRTRRPFYAEYAWAFELLIERPVEQECEAIVDWLIHRGIRPGAKMLDAGCGTGRYALLLASHGYSVDGIDSSPELIEEARRRAHGVGSLTSFEVRDLTVVTPNHYDGVLCRGVLNDIIEDESRHEAIAALYASLRPGGVCILDVRDWEATAKRKSQQPIFTKTVATGRGVLTFTSVTELDPTGRRMLLSERHTLVVNGVEQSTDYHFVMRCWTHDELQSLLVGGGFLPLEYFGAYDATVGAGSTDRIVAVAQRPAI